MNLFDLFVTIGVKDETTGPVSQIKATTIAAGQLMADAAKTAGSAIVNLGKQAIAGFAETEQLRGGVETLFKDSAATIQSYADEAYKTAGMSANEYMSTITGFSASLLQSLGGDTAAAAEYGNMAVMDMADNANKMGTSIESIQNAYQGFAKQNYTMLDNLKLGYGGTAQEMYRLLSDAKEIDETFDAVFSLDNKGHLEAGYADIVEAIHIVQTEMGITGTTAKEANQTISGSAATMKAAWQNLVTGFADENANVDELLDNFMDSVETTASNVLPVVERVLTSIFSSLQENGPEMIASGARLLGKLAAGALKAIPTIISSIPEIVVAIVNGFEESGPDILNIGKDIVRGIWDGIQSLAGWLWDQVSGFVGGIVDNVKGALGIHSPSRVFAGIGENMALGLGDGWNREYNAIRSDITNGLDFGTGHVDFASSGLGVSSAGIINGLSGGQDSGAGNMSINLVLPDGTAFARYFLPSFIDVAKANGTPIANPL